MKVIEHSDRWSILGNADVDTLRFDWAVTVVIGTGEDRLEIRIESRFTLNGEVFDPEDEPALLAPVLRLLRREACRVDAFKDGHLELEFSHGSLLIVPSSDEYEPWGMVGEGGFRIVSTPGNGLAVWR